MTSTSSATAGRTNQTASEPVGPTSFPEVPWNRSVWTWFWGGLLAACVPFLVIYFSRMWRLPHYQYFPFAIVAVLWLVWTRSDRKFHPPATIASWIGLLAGAAAMTGGLVLRSPWLVAIAFVLFAAGCLSCMQGRRRSSLLSLALPLALLVRLPLGYDLLLVIELQRITTVLSSLMLDVLGISHSIARNTIELVDRELFVAEACSGIQSVFTLAFLATLIVAIKGRRLWLVPFYLVIALILAVTGNVIRVTTVATVDTWFGWDWAVGWPHEVLGYTTLGLSVLLLLSFDQLIVSLLHATGTSSQASKHNPIALLWNGLVDDGSTVDTVEEYYLQGSSRRATSTLSVYQQRISASMNRMQAKPVVVVLLCLSVTLLGVSTLRAFSVERMESEGGSGLFVDGLIFEPTPDLFTRLTSAEFTLSQHTIARDNENPVLGRNADTWNYRRPVGTESAIEGQFVISQAYAEFHELCFCYELQDWELLNRFRKSFEQGEGETAQVPVACATFRTPTGGRGYLWYASISASGKMMMPPEKPGRLGSRFADAIEETETSDSIMMIQLWITSAVPLDNQTTNQLAADFALLRRKIAEEVSK